MNDYDPYYDDEDGHTPRLHRPSALDELHRRRALDEHRRRGQLPTDWNDRRELQRFVYHWMEEHGPINPLKMEIGSALRREDITFAQAVALILEIPHREERVFKECVQALPFGDLTPEQRLLIMNDRRLVRAISDFNFLRIRDEVLENGDRRALGFAWIDAGGRHFSDREIAYDFKRGAISTHCVEVIQELGDDSVAEADAFLLERLRRGLGPEIGTSYKTAEFLCAFHMFGTDLLAPEQRAELASEMIIMLVGSQSQDSRKAGADIGVRPQHQKLRTVDYLIGIIAAQMTAENAGVILRWTMGRHRHHKWVWERIMAAFRRFGWRIETVQRFGTGELGVGWWLGSHQIVVLPSDGSVDEVGELEVGKTNVLVPPNRLLGPQVDRGTDWVLYKHPLHPLRPPTPAMREALQKSKT